jgi:bifunctional DNA primase/polymerase-like protein
MFARWPGGDVGFKTGRGSDVGVLDFDPCHGGFASLRKLEAGYGKLPTTREHVTGGDGAHLLYTLPKGLEALRSMILAPGVELKADGAGVVLPPSNHASGGKYAVLVDTPLAPLPSWVMEMAHELRVLKGGAEQPTESRFELPKRIVESSPSRPPPSPSYCIALMSVRGPVPARARA